MRHFLICGSHPKLSLAEAKAVIGGEKPTLAGPMAIFDSQSWDDLLLQERLAGTVKLGEILVAIDSEQLATSNLANKLADLIEAMPRADRVLYGLSILGGTQEQRRQIKQLPIELKKELKRRGRSSRWVTGEQGDLSPAAVAKLKLTSEGYDFCIGLTGDNIYIGLTTQVQNATAWSVRDYDRPFRDTRTGMLPPKLARMMVNLAVGSDAQTSDIIYDPFCGGGAVIMESLLMLPKAQVIGSDIAAKQIAGSQQNLSWLKDNGLIAPDDLQNRLKLFVAPASKAADHLNGKIIDAIVTEGFLGKPLQGNEPQSYLEKNLREAEEVWRESLPTLAKLQATGGRLVACAPSYKTSQGKIALDLSKLAENHGYRLIDPLLDWTERVEALVYAREGQHVARQIFIFEKI